MADIAIDWSNDLGIGDWIIQNGDLVAGDDLLTSVLLQLFTDNTCDPGFVPSDGDARGWWGNYYSETPVGSKLWQLDRAKFAANTSVLLQARDFTREAMQVFIDSGIASSVSVDVQKIDIYSIAVSIQMFRPKIPTPTTIKFAYVWNTTN